MAAISSTSIDCLASGKKRSFNEHTNVPSASNKKQLPGHQNFGFEQIAAIGQSPSNSSDKFQSSSVFSPRLTNPYALSEFGLARQASTAYEDKQLQTISECKSDSLSVFVTPKSDLSLLQNMSSTTLKHSDLQFISKAPASTVPINKLKRARKSKSQSQQEFNTSYQHPLNFEPGFTPYIGAESNIGALNQSSSAFNFAGPNPTSVLYDKESGYTFLDEIRSPNLQNYYSIALRQQAQQHQQVQEQQTNSKKVEVTSQVNIPVAATAVRNYSGHPFLQPTAQRSNAYGPPVPPYVTTHGPNLGVDPTTYQNYLHSFYA